MAADGPALGVSTAAAAPAERLLSLPGWQIRITASDAISASLASVLASIRLGETIPPLDLSVAPDGHHATGTVGGRQLWSAHLPRTGWLPLLLAQVGATGAALLRRLLFVHAGAVALDGHGWVIVGESGAGKTSTVAALVRMGASYLTDEITVLDATSGAVQPFALPMAVKPWTAEAVGPLPDGSEVASEGGVRFYLPARLAGDPVPVEAFVLIASGRGAALTPLSRSEMLMALAQHPSSLRYAHRLQEAFSGFSRLLRGARCYTLAAPSPATAADLIVGADRAS